MKTYTRDELQEILEKHKMWLNNKAGGKCANFQEAVLRESNFQKAVLWGANFQEADLCKANFQEAVLRESNFQKADLRGANFQKADLCESNFQKAVLWGANFQEADLCKANFQEAVLRESNFQKAVLWGADFRRAYLWRTNFQKADIDYSCWPLWYGSFGVKIDKRIAAQLAYHFCRTICDDPEVVAAQNALLPLANQFHRVNECGEIKPMKARNEG
jgi:hypothetical protein